jgi:alpha-D-ribose 1-methylphosphonate 5-triphosphate diphosphatase
MTRTLLAGCRLVLAGEVIEKGDLLIEEETIAALDPDVRRCADYLDLDGVRLLPEMIDRPCDVLEKEIEPRPGIRLPMDGLARHGPGSPRCLRPFSWPPAGEKK